MGNYGAPPAMRSFVLGGLRAARGHLFHDQNPHPRHPRGAPLGLWGTRSRGRAGCAPGKGGDKRFVVRSGDSHCGAPEAGRGFGSELELASVGSLVLVPLWADRDQRAGAGRQEGKEGRSPLVASQLAAQQVVLCLDSGADDFPSAICRRYYSLQPFTAPKPAKKQAKPSQNSRPSDVVCIQQPALRGIYEKGQAPALAAFGLIFLF